jgi:iron-sulfur cluster repair protein YtfE (RIC family)
MAAFNSNRRSAMVRVTDPLREEHSELRPSIELLREAGDAVSHDNPAELKRIVEQSYTFLIAHLIPHAMAEDKALYPVVGRVMGAAGATRTMSRDHVEVGRLTEELGRLRPAISPQIQQVTKDNLRRVLYGLYALVSVHFAKEEEIYLPLLDDRLEKPEAEAMFAAMEEAAAGAKAAIGAKKAG